MQLLWYPKLCLRVRSVHNALLGILVYTYTHTHRERMVHIAIPGNIILIRYMHMCAYTCIFSVLYASLELSIRPFVHLSLGPYPYLYPFAFCPYVHAS